MLGALLHHGWSTHPWTSKSRKKHHHHHHQVPILSKVDPLPKALTQRLLAPAGLVIVADGCTRRGRRHSQCPPSKGATQLLVVATRPAERRCCPRNRTSKKFRACGGDEERGAAAGGRDAPGGTDDSTSWGAARNSCLRLPGRNIGWALQLARLLAQRA